MPDRHRPRQTATSPRSKPRNKPKQHSVLLWQPAYSTVLGDYRSVVADTEADLDINPDLAPITATVTAGRRSPGRMRMFSANVRETRGRSS